MYRLDWGLPLRDPYLGWLLKGLRYTGFLTIVTGSLSFGLGVIVAAARISPNRFARFTATAFVEVLRNVPTLYWIFFFYFVVPALPSDDIAFALNQWDYLPLTAAIVAITLSHAAHVGEVLRGGLQSLPEVQRRAAISLGLRPRQVFWSVLLPQAIRITYPALGPRMVHNFHNTALATVATVPELTWQAQRIETVTFRGFEALTVATALFIAGSLLINVLFKTLEFATRMRPNSLAR
jgi:His/Glu/Gln/Arg/opine family amino acid ABC transporter permease subunit